MLDLSGQTALVTGSSRGIGRAIAIRLAAAGARTVVHCDRSRAEAASVVEEITRAGGQAIALFADVARSDQVEQMFREIDRRFGRIDVLVNGAGRNRDLPAVEMTDEDFLVPIETQLIGTFYCCRSAGRRMLRQHSGRIINIGAATGIRGRRNGANYCAAKAGVMVLTKALALEFAPHVRVNCLVPGFTTTDDVLDRFDLRDPEKRARHEATIPLGHLADPGDIAEWALWLAADAPHATGQYFFVNGGAYLG